MTKELTDQQKAGSRNMALTIAELADDLKNKIVYSGMATLAAWGGLQGFGVHIPFLPVWLLTLTGLLFTRHVSRTVGKAVERGQFETTIQNFLRSTPKGTPAPGVQFDGQMLPNQKFEGDGPYL